MEGAKVLELLTTAIDFGWPLLVLIVALSLFKQTKVSDPAEKKSMMFNTMIGIVAAIMLLIAIVNYRDNFGIDDGKLPISLVMITSLTFLMGVYFSNIGALMKIGGFMFFVAAALSGYGLSLIHI